MKMEPFRVLMAGGRNYDREDVVRFFIEKLEQQVGEHPVVVVHGDCPARSDGTPGADQLADRLAREYGLAVEPHPADWRRHGRAAGPIRNRVMARSGLDMAILFPGGVGTHNMLTELRIVNETEDLREVSIVQVHEDFDPEAYDERSATPWLR